MLCRPTAFAAELGRSAVTATLPVHQKQVSFQMDMLRGPLADALTFAVQVSEGLCRPIIGVADPDTHIAAVTETLAVHQKDVSFQMDMLLGPLADALTFAVQVSEGLCRQIIGVADPDIQIAGIALRTRPHAPHDEQRIYSWPAGGEVAVIA